MAKKVAVLAVNPVNGCGLFQYLEAFFENGISYKVFAVSDTKDIKTNSGISLTVDDVIANLKGHEDEFDTLVFSCGDAVPVFQQNADKPYNVDLMQVIKTFGDKGKIMIGHCAGAMMFDFTGITKGKKVAVLAVNPVNGCGLFQYLEAFFENGISYKVFAVSDTKEIKTNSGISLTTDDVIANLKGHEDEFDAFVFSCGDAVPVFQQNADKPYNIDLMEAIKTFGDKGKIMIGHCAGAMMFDFTGITKGKKVAVHPLAKPAIQNGIATDEKSEIDGNFFTAQDENTIWTMLPQVIEALK